MSRVIHDRREAKGRETFSRAHDFDADVTEGFDDAHRLFDDLRERCPVAHSNDFEGFWVLTRYADIEAAMDDSSLFSTAVQNVVPRVATTGRRPPLHLDPPEHTPYRRAISPLFRRERMEHWGPVVRGIARRLFEPLVPQGEFDLCLDYSYHLPIHVLAEFFMIPDETAQRVRAIGKEFNLALQTKDVAAMQRTSLFLYEVAQGVIDERKARPLDPTVDPTSALLAARDNGEQLPEHLILGTIRQLLVVGIIAPTTFLGSVGVHFSRHPEHFTMLKDDPSLIPAATEELLRLYTPYRGFARTPTREVDIGGRTIREDEPVALAFAAANRDPEAFKDPAEFRLDRTDAPPHLAFGRGPHMCAGAPLARLMLTASIEVFTDLCDGFELVGETPMTTWPEYGPISVPLRLR
ncbi:cytochrome P450 [Wenxinia marina]|uniref:Cytochrome P450 n=1 Tax=Wenxinia marina DSM 24838 TaxID=1123501 RepID=A0A0D0NNI9_9RHOB|nr:cytochrome P450 [Wenxinia marina]KIQ69815.1 Cytochrome P450 [Wenxinia marina DSM 24838]GGL61461.1 cytochrome P450 [Wenxinia marina]